MSFFHLGPHIPSANVCKECDKHLRVVHSGTPRCDRCLPDDVSQLKTCACHLARYCSAQCQKNNWKAHRESCQNPRHATQFSRTLGPTADARHLSFVEWCKHSNKQYGPSALWALGTGTDADRTGTHIFVIYLDIGETISKGGKNRFKHRVRSAKCASEAEVKQECAPEYSAGSKWKVPPAIPFCTRILVIDDGLPNMLDLFDHVVAEVDIGKIRSKVFPGMECDWLPLLKDSVAAGDQLPIQRYIHRPGSTPAVHELRYKHTKSWKISYADVFAMAAASALDIPRHPQRIVTHSLVLHIDVEEERQGVFGKHTVRSAKMMSLAEIRPLFHGDTHLMQVELFPQPNMLRTVIVDDYLPFGRNIQVLGIDMSKALDPRTSLPYHSNWFTLLKRMVEQ
ncbi:hypothetical protein C8F04DRAFT_530540 [Mycena alexandri]|uniref:MYND-type domain-containing protein n=1 Tax=Mycena alexandri TaxID=1745969 RepID=A0AAD6X1J0_9AGAR|nr:hypothetical protein C8F04DRAFT_530540 [Mycena alexandri]